MSRIIGLLALLVMLPFSAIASEQEESAKNFALSYFEAKESGEYEKAFRMQAERLQQSMTFDGFKKIVEETKKSVGGYFQREIYLVTIIENPPNSSPGVYAALDFIGSGKNVYKACGYIILLQTSEGVWEVSREEQNMLDNETFNEDPEKVEQIWSLMAQNYCPNYDKRPR